MELIGQAIRHEVYGKGVVTEQGKGTLTVCFAAGEKRFIYPDAFDGYLTLKNDQAQASIQALLQSRAARDRERLEHIQAAQDKKNRLLTMRITPCSQAVFNIRREEEEDVFAQWHVHTGQYLSGVNKGQPRTPDRLRPNSMCLLTMRPDQGQEAERLLLGAFMVRDSFQGTACFDGRVPAHPVYRLRLETPILFWPCIEEHKRTLRWGSTTFRYITNTAAEPILYAMVRQKLGTAEEEQARAFYHYYCTINHMEQQRLPEN